MILLVSICNNTSTKKLTRYNMGPKNTLFKDKIRDIPLALLNMNVLVTNFKM